MSEAKRLSEAAQSEVTAAQKRGWPRAKSAA